MYTDEMSKYILMSNMNSIEKEKALIGILHIFLNIS